MSLSENFSTILAFRILFAFFTAVQVPVSISLMTDYFNKSFLGRANSVYAFGVYLGGGLSSLSILLDL